MEIVKNGDIITIHYDGLTDKNTNEFFDDLERSCLLFNGVNYGKKEFKYDTTRYSERTVKREIYRLICIAEKYNFDIAQDVRDFAVPAQVEEEKRQERITISQADVKKRSGCCLCEFLKYQSRFEPYCTYAEKFCEVEEDEYYRKRESLKLYGTCDRITAYPCQGCKYTEEATAIIARILRESVI